MNTQPALKISEENYQKLSQLVRQASQPIAALLEEELGRAEVFAAHEIPGDIVTMNSRIRYLDVESEKEVEVTLVYPHEADLEQNRLSVLAPIGVALIGLAVGQSIHWILPNGRPRLIRILEMIEQGK